MEVITQGLTIARLEGTEARPMLLDAVASAEAGVGVSFQNHVHFHNINITHKQGFVKGF